MQIQLCKKSLENQREKMAVLVADLSDREHTIVMKDCLNRCQGCQLGLIIAVVEGAPLSAKNPEKFLADLDELADES